MSETPTTQPAPAMSDVPAVPACPTPDGTPRGTKDDNGQPAGQERGRAAAAPDVQKVWDNQWDSPDQPQRQNTPESPESELVPNRRPEPVPHPHPLKGGGPFGTALPPGESAVITGDGSGWIAVCPTCSARLGVSQAGWLTCNGDGSHTWTPAEHPWAGPPQPEHSSGSPRVMGSEPTTAAWCGSCHHELPHHFQGCLMPELQEAEADRDRAQRLVEALWPANLLAGTAAPVDTFPVIAAIVHELGRPLGEWSVQVERQSMTTDDGDVDVELVSLHRVTGRTA